MVVSATMNPTTFFPNSHAIAIGLPKMFDLVGALKGSGSIRLATAFAHNSGWSLLSNGISSTTGDVRLLTGLYFCQTEPRLLRKWLKLAKGKPNVEAKLFSGKQMFHPKVLIVGASSANGSFALVGSGNLSRGGFATNVECWLYTSAKDQVAALTLWFDGHFDKSTDLNLKAIKDYDPRYRKAQKAAKAISHEQKGIEQELEEIRVAKIADRARAVKEAQIYFRSPKFLKSWRESSRKVDRLRDALDYPDLNVTKKGWESFYDNWTLGHLVPIYRDRVIKDRQRLQGALKHLIDDSIPVTNRLASVLDKSGKFYISGMGLNTVSKILACHDRKQWPVYNEPVETALREFGYDFPRSGSRAMKYLAFKRAMESFMKDSKARDVVALDRFFHFISQGVKSKSKGKT